MKKKLLSMFLAFTMLCTILSTPASAASFPPGESAYWHNTTESEALSLLHAKPSSGYLVFVYYSNGCGNSRQAVPQMADFADENSITMYGYDANDNANDSVGHAVFRFLNATSLTWPVVFVFNYSAGESASAKACTLNTLISMLRDQGLYSGSGGGSDDDSSSDGSDNDNGNGGSAITLTNDSSISDAEWDVLRLTNQHRMSIGLEPLTTTDQMQKAANQRAQELVTLYSHSRPDGSDCFTVMKDYGISYSIVAENIAKGYTSAAAVVNGWLNSEGHRANIETKTLTHLGVGMESLCWSQNFAGGQCSYSGLSLSKSSISGKVGQDLEELLTEADIRATARCSQHGSSSLPVIADMCSGYNTSNAGTQQVSVTLGGTSAELSITLTVSDTSNGGTNDGNTNGGDTETGNTNNGNDINEGDQESSETKLPFKDITDHWATEGITYAYKNRLFSGTTDTTFEPDIPMSRAMMVTVLARYAGVDTSGGETWYAKGRQWAMTQNVSDGYNMMDNITREQVATMLYRYVGEPATTGNLSQFSDASKVSSYAVDAMRWAVEKGIINGINGTLTPQGNATRAQVATMMMRFCEM